MKAKHSQNPGSPSAGEPKIVLPDGQPAPSTPPASNQPDPAAEIASLKDQLLSVRADFENSRKRLTREKEESLKYANQSILSVFLPLLDHLELGLQAAASAKDVASVVSGLKLIQSQFERFLTDHGVTVVVVVHDLNPLLPHLDGAVYLLDGHAHYGPVAEVVDAELLTHLYGTQVKVVRTAQGDLFTRGA